MTTELLIQFLERLPPEFQVWKGQVSNTLLFGNNGRMAGLIDLRREIIYFEGSDTAINRWNEAVPYEEDQTDG